MKLSCLAAWGVKGHLNTITFSGCLDIGINVFPAV